MLKTNFGSCIGNKFNADGSVRHFPGNTIVCILDHESDVFKKVKETRARFENCGASSCFTFLPDDSLHMTAIEGVVDEVRDAPHWTSKLPLDAPLVEVDDFFEREFKKLPKLGEVRMTFDHLWLSGALVIAFRPETPEYEKRIRSWRDVVGDALGLHFPGHETYTFHSGLAYGIRQPNHDEAEILETLTAQFDKECKEAPFSFTVPEPSLTFFDDMFFFNKKRIPRDA